MKKARRPVFLLLFVQATVGVTGYLTWDALIADLNRTTSLPAALAGFATIVLYVFVLGMLFVITAWNLALNIAADIRDDVREEAKKLATAEAAKTDSV